MENITTTETTEKKLPWYKTLDKNKQSFLRHYQGKDHQEAVKDLLLPAVYHVGEIIHSEDKPPQVRLQAAQIIINKCISDKINIPQLNKAFNVSQHIDNLVIKQTIINQAISKSDNNGVIDITPNQDSIKDNK